MFYSKATEFKLKIHSELDFLIYVEKSILTQKVLADRVGLTQETKVSRQCYESGSFSWDDCINFSRTIQQFYYP